MLKTLSPLTLLPLSLWAQSPASPPPGQGVLSATGSSERTRDDEVVALSVFEVTEQGGLGYRSTQTLSGASTVAQIRDLPSSISVMNRELMEDLMVTSIDELSSYYVSGEIEPVPETPIASGSAVRMRGLTTGNLRDGIYLAAALDSHSIDRVEILRGPNGFLYTGAGAGGNPNQVTKQAMRKDAESVRLMVGSYNLHRAELDVNRVLTPKLALRTSLAYQKADARAHHAGRRFWGALVTANYRPFGGTNINLSVDYGDDYATMAQRILANQFANTERDNTTTAYTAATGGLTYVPAFGLIYDTTGMRRSTGTNIALSDPSFISPETNYRGPDAFNSTRVAAHSLTVDQRIGEKLYLQLTVHHMEVRKIIRTTIGSSVGGVYKDTNLTLPDGSPNPYYNEYYNEYVNRDYHFTEPTKYYRGAAVYDLELPFTKQRIIGTVHHHWYDPNFTFVSEFVDPRSSLFKGAFINAETLAAYQANLTTQNQNRFYRRFYLRDGDSARFTRADTVPGVSTYLRDITGDGASGRLFWRDYWNNGGAIGATGTYFEERLHSFVGWRTDSFERTTGNIFYNVAADGGVPYRSTSNVSPYDFQLPSHQRQNPKTRVRGDSTNYGLVYHAFKFLSFYANYAESVSLNVAAGGDGLIPGTKIPSPKGFGEDYGLRWLFRDGAIESNWTYYKNNRMAGAAIPAAVTSELALIYTDINPSATDTQDVTAEGIEFDTILNINRNLRLLWNFSSNKLSNTNRYPAVKSVQERARNDGEPIPDTDAFLASVPEGTPSAGFTKIRSNLVGSYRFTSGPLNGFSIGGGAQYRDVTYQGNFDLNRDGVAEELWTPSYVVVNLMLGYRTQFWNRPVQLGLNVNNLLDKHYFRATSLPSGAWGDERNFRLSAKIDL